MFDIDTLQQLLDKKSLFFPDNLEKQFQDDYHSRSLRSIRVALILAFILYTLFGYLDVIIAPSTTKIIWFIRFALVSPVLIIAYILSYTPIFKKAMQLILGISAFVMGAGIIAMIAIARDIETGLYYYAGLMLVITWTYTFVRLRFIFASAVCWSIVIGYEISAIFFQNMLTSPDLIRVFINNNFFFISANIIGMLVCLTIEASSRRDFLHRLIIEEKQKDLEQERNQLKDRNEIMQNDLEMARVIQEEMIPDKEPNDNIAFMFKPMEPVGGDLFDFIKFREHDKIGIFISDVSGHGASAALITSMVKSLMNKSMTLKNDPAAMMYSLNESLCNNTGNHFITAFYGVHTASTRTIVYCNAGHPNPIIITGEGTSYLSKGNGLPLAFLENKDIINSSRKYANTEEILPEKSRVLFYTDGLIEAAPNRDRTRMFINNIHDVLFNIRADTSKDFIQKLYHSLVLHTGSEQFDDDICIVCLNTD